MQLAKPQKYYGPHGLFVVAIFFNLSTLMAIDMFVPALPAMQQEFQVSEAFLNLTVFFFTIGSAVSTLFSGAISDRVGRKPMLLVSMLVFVTASAGCAVSFCVEMLIPFRILQALAYGSVFVVSTALIKDSYEGESLKVAMTCFQSLIIIGPVVSPFLGALMMVLWNWHAIFWLLVILSAASVPMILLLNETFDLTLANPQACSDSAESREANAGSADLEQASAGSSDLEQAAGDATANAAQSGSAPIEHASFGQATRKMLSDMVILLEDKSFMSLALLMGVSGIPYIAFISTASYILMVQFSAGYLGYSISYAVVSLFSVAAPYAFLILSKRLPNKFILGLALGLVGGSALLLGAIGQFNPILFTLAVVPAIFSEGVIRSLAFIDLLDQPADRVGSASSLSNSCYCLCNALGSVLATLPFWPNFVIGLCAITAVSTLTMVGLYFYGVRPKR